MRLDKSNARRRLHNKGKQYEKEIDLPATGSVRREEQERFGNGVVCAIRGQRFGGNLAVCGATGDVADAANRERT